MANSHLEIQLFFFFSTSMTRQKTHRTEREKSLKKCTELKKTTTSFLFELVDFELVNLRCTLR